MCEKCRHIDSLAVCCPEIHKADGSPHIPNQWRRQSRWFHGEKYACKQKNPHSKEMSYLVSSVWQSYLAIISVLFSFNVDWLTPLPCPFYPTVELMNASFESEGFGEFCAQSIFRHTRQSLKESECLVNFYLSSSKHSHAFCGVPKTVVLRSAWLEINLAFCK